MVEPDIPADVWDVGFASQPNLELLVALRPTLVLLEGRGATVETRIRRVVPTFLSPSKSPSISFLAKSISDARSIGEATGKRADAERLISDTLAEFETFRNQLKVYDQRPVYVVRFYGGIFGYGHDSLLGNVLDALGLENAWGRELGGQVETPIGLQHLTGIPNARLICFTADDSKRMVALTTNPLWANFDFVKQRRIRFLQAVWPFGGLICARRFARLLTSALLEPDGASDG